VTEATEATEASDHRVRVDVDGPVAVVTLDRADRRNAMDPAFFDAVAAAAVAVEDDPAVRCAVVVAAGDHFSVGLDLRHVQADLDQAEAGSQAEARLALWREIRRVQAALTRLADCAKPVIAVTHGWCIGGGIDLILACDIRMASADTRFSIRETKMGIVADLGTLQRLPRVVPAGHVAELAFSGREFDADHACAVGLVNRVAPTPAAARKEALALARQIAENSPLVVQGVKQVLRMGADLGVQAGLEYVASWNAAFLPSDDLAEAVSAYFERRPPSFEGR